MAHAIWSIGSFEFPEKPVTIFETSPHSVHAPAQLREVLGTMSARIVEQASLILPLRGMNLDGNALAQTPEYAGPVRQAMKTFSLEIAAMETSQPS